MCFVDINGDIISVIKLIRQLYMALSAVLFILIRLSISKRFYSKPKDGSLIPANFLIEYTYCNIYTTIYLLTDCMWPNEFSMKFRLL